MNPRQIFKNLGNITTPFMGRTKDELQHKGVDFANKSGTPIPAFEDGTIQSVGMAKNGMGNTVVMKSRDGNTHQYGHLQNFLVKPGQQVKKGIPIAKMGKTGNSYSPTGSDPSHLDIRISDAYGKWKNPLSVINKK